MLGSGSQIIKTTVRTMMSKPKRPKLETLTPILNDELIEEVPTIEVYVGTIKDPKTTSKLVLELNKILPIPELGHLKRVRGLQILLLPRNAQHENSSDVWNFLASKKFDRSLIEDELQILSVAGLPPKIRKQYNIVQKLWPCKFYPDLYLEKLTTNTLFSDKELETHSFFMEIALEICTITDTKNGVLVVDPCMNSIVGIGFSQTDENPIKHAVMIAIDDVATRQNGGAWVRSCAYSTVITRIKTKFQNLRFDYAPSEEGPYLCTGCYIYSVNEPCITCAMALVHSRAKRVFYGAKSRIGGLGTLCKIHCIGNLNHHYEAFGGLLEEQCEFLQK